MVWEELQRFDNNDKSYQGLVSDEEIPSSQLDETCYLSVRTGEKRREIREQLVYDRMRPTRVTWDYFTSPNVIGSPSS